MIGRVLRSVAVATWSAAILARNGDANDADSNLMNGYGHMNGYEHMMGPWGGWILMWLLLLIAAGVVIYFLVRGLASGGGGQPPHETPLDILKKRYARGEITKEQFDEMKKDL